MRHNPRMRSLVLIGVLFAFSAPVWAQTAAKTTPATTTSRLSIDIPRVSGPPRFEDFLSGDPAGAAPGVELHGEIQRGVRITGFLQRDPGDLVPISQGTDAYVSYDDTHLYAVFVCRASDPARVRARMAKRESVFSDDFVAILLDTFNDRQRSYMFFSNPLGVQADGITSEGQGDDMSFDTVWGSRGQLTSFGYVVSISIPFKSLRFLPGTGPRTWGIALMRAIPANDEQAFWPGITNKISGFTSQFAEAHGMGDVSPGRNVQVTPYGTFTGARFLDGSTFERDADGRAGVDTKMVLRDAVTLDLTANPDFSQVESDEPQVTINQRFEVFFPEKRPFFLENAGYFQTPLNLFFSRRVRDPQVGARATGKMGNWAVGALAIDDRAQGNALDQGDPQHGDRAWSGVVRARREFGDSSIGGLITSRDFGSSFNRVASADTRLRLNPRWFVDGQAVVSDTRSLDGTSTRDTAFIGNLSRSSRKLSYYLTYQDIGKDFRTALGFVPRTDIRQVAQFATWRWRPKHGPIIALGPNSFVQETWDRAGTVQDWLIRYPFQIDFKGQSGLFVRRAESMERFEGIEFRQYENMINFYSSRVKWLDFSVYAANGTRPNFYPGSGLTPFLANFRDVTLSMTFRPMSRLLLDETYIYSHLASRADTGYRGTIFDNHIARSRMNYQFTRELSLRAIVDYNGVLANSSLVALDRTKHITADVLVTYLLHPGTAVYVGYTDGYDNVAVDDRGVRFTRNPTTATGRQFFVKTSYLFRF
jgi:hypothetical protein